MQLLQAWAESLSLFKPDTLKPFLLVTLKSIIETYKALISKFWAIILGCLVIDLTAYYLLTQTTIQGFQISSMMGIGFWFLIFFSAMAALMALNMTIFLSARPSTAPKSWGYLLSYWRHFISFFFIWFVGMACKNLFLFLFIYWIFFVAFLLDSRGSLKSLGLSFWRSLKMMWYNLPFVMLSSLVFSLLFFPLTLLLDSALFDTTLMVSPWAFIIRFCVVNFIQLPILICFYINFYVKKIHEQFSLYFPVKGQ